MVLAVLPMVELVEVAEGVHHGLEDRFPKIGVDIYTESIHKNFVKLAQKLLPFATPPVSVSSKRHSVPPPFIINTSSKTQTFNDFVTNKQNQHLENKSDFQNIKKVFPFEICTWFDDLEK